MSSASSISATSTCPASFSVAASRATNARTVGDLERRLRALSSDRCCFGHRLGLRRDRLGAVVERVNRLSPGAGGRPRTAHLPEEHCCSLRRNLRMLRKLVRHASRARRTVPGLRYPKLISPLHKRSGCRPVESAYQIEQDRLTRTGGPYDRDHFTLLNGEIDPFQCGDVALPVVVLGNSGDSDQIRTPRSQIAYLEVLSARLRPILTHRL